MSSSMFPFRKRISPIQMLLILQLKHGAKYGYEMLKNIREEFKGVWEPKTGTIYPALKSLESRDIVKTVTRDETEFYLLTEKGDLMLHELGIKVQGNVKFTFRFLTFLYKWLPDDMLDTVVDVIRIIAEEDHNVFPLLINKLTKEARQDVYEDLKKIFQNRVRTLEATIGEENE